MRRAHGGGCGGSDFVMRFRPCIDIHNGRVKQIVGGSLRDQSDSAEENFVSEQTAAWYASLYRRDDEFCEPRLKNI